MSSWLLRGELGRGEHMRCADAGEAGLCTTKEAQSFHKGGGVLGGLAWA